MDLDDDLMFVDPALVQLLKYFLRASSINPEEIVSDEAAAMTIRRFLARLPLESHGSSKGHRIAVLTIKAPGTSAVSVKPRNVRRKLLELGKVPLQSIALGAALVHHSWTAIFLSLAFYREVKGALTSEIVPADVPIVWGMTMLPGYDKEEGVAESAILQTTNDELQKQGRALIQPGDFQTSLQRLQMLGSLRKIGDDHWRAGEAFVVEY